MKAKLVLLVVLMLTLVISGCVTKIPDQDVFTSTAEIIYGFWAGLWHGLTTGFRFIGSLFDKDIILYAVNNNGGWYNFGYVLGVGGGFVGGSKLN